MPGRSIDAMRDGVTGRRDSTVRRTIRANDLNARLNFSGQRVAVNGKLTQLVSGDRIPVGFPIAEPIVAVAIATSRICTKTRRQSGMASGHCCGTSAGGNTISTAYHVGWGHTNQSVSKPCHFLRYFMTRHSFTRVNCYSFRRVHCRAQAAVGEMDSDWQI